MIEEKFLELLKEQSNNLVSLLKTVLKKQKAIISGDADLMEKLTSREEKNLLLVNRVEKSRIELLHNYQVETGSENKEEFFTRMARKLDSPDEKLFGELRKKIKDTTKVILQVNEQNRYLISQSRTMLNEIVAAVFSERKTSLLDRRV